MTRLVTSEVARWFARRLLWVVSAGAVALMVLGPVDAWSTSGEPSAAERAYAQQQVDEYVPMSDEDRATCLEDQQRERDASGDPTLDLGCDWVPTVEDFLPGRGYWDTHGLSSLWGFVTFLVLAALAAGASFVAAEFSTGAISSWLTFAPRRLRVFASKLVASVLGFAPTAVLAVAVLVGGTWGAYAARGALTNPQPPVDDAWSPVGLADGVAAGGRMVALALAVVVLGAALGFLLRHTAAVLGAVLVWFVVVETILAELVQRLRGWTFQTNVDAWVRDGTEWYEEVCGFDAESGGRACEYVAHTVTAAQGAAVLGTMVVVVVALAALVFRRRDVA